MSAYLILAETFGTKHEESIRQYGSEYERTQQGPI